MTRWSCAVCHHHNGRFAYICAKCGSHRGMHGRPKSDYIKPFFWIAVGIFLGHLGTLTFYLARSCP